MTKGIDFVHLPNLLFLLNCRQEKKLQTINEKL